MVAAAKFYFSLQKMASKSSTFVWVALATIVIATTASAKLTSDEKKELLNMHNHYRSNVYPTATNMVKLVSRSGSN